MIAAVSSGASAVVFRDKYMHALEIAVVVVVAGWQVAGAGVLMVTHLARYTAPGVEVAAWVVQAGIIAVGAVLLLRKRLHARVAWALVALDVAAGIAAMSACPRYGMLSANWAWGTTAWVGVLLLLHRPVWELVVLIIIAALITLAGLALVGDLHRRSVAGFISTLYASASIQLAVVVATGALGLASNRAARAAAAEAQATTRRLVAKAVHAARQARYQAVQAAIAPLLAGLADGSLHPDDRSVQHRCAVEEARLRRMFAERDDVPDPLIHELQACADVAGRRGVAVDWGMVGAVPQIPVSVRRELTDAAIEALATAQAKARVTVIASQEEVAVSIFSDSPAGPPAARPGGRILVNSQRDKDGLWVEAQWRVR
jgi:hypothetical protein